MLESFIISLREGIEIALVIGILVVYLQKLQKNSLIKMVRLGLVFAIIISILGAFLIKKFSFDQESFEGFFMLAAAIFVGTMIVWMWKTSKGLKREMEQKIDLIIEQSISWKMQLGIFLFTFIMVAREGIELVIFLGAVAIHKNAWYNVLGGIAGLVGAVFFGILFIRGSIRIDIARFLKVTAVVLLIFVFQLLVNAIHEFYEYGILPAQPVMMGIVGPIVRHNLLFLLAILCIPGLLFMIPNTRKQKSEAVMPTYRRWQLSAGIVSLSVVFFLGFDSVFSSRNSAVISPAEIVTPDQGIIQIPTAIVDDGALHRFIWNDGEVQIRFFVLRTGLTTFATAFDACRACYNYGKFYLQNGDLICSQCDAPSQLTKLNTVHEEFDEDNSGSMEGNGCAPIFLPSKLRDGKILVSVEDLKHQLRYFDIKN